MIRPISRIFLRREDRRMEELIGALGMTEDEIKFYRKIGGGSEVPPDVIDKLSTLKLQIKRREEEILVENDHWMEKERKRLDRFEFYRWHGFALDEKIYFNHVIGSFNKFTNINDELLLTSFASTPYLHRQINYILRPHEFVYRGVVGGYKLHSFSF